MVTARNERRAAAYGHRDSRSSAGCPVADAQAPSVEIIAALPIRPQWQIAECPSDGPPAGIEAAAPEEAGAAADVPMPARHCRLGGLGSIE